MPNAAKSMKKKCKICNDVGIVNYYAYKEMLHFE